MVRLEVEKAAMVICENKYSYLIDYLGEKTTCFNLSRKLEIFYEILLSPVKLMDCLKQKQRRTGEVTIPVLSGDSRTLERKKCTTSCLLISFVENVLFWWMSRVSDHSVLFLRFVGVGPVVLLLALRGIPGDLLSPRNDMDYKGEIVTVKL